MPLDVGREADGIAVHVVDANGNVGPARVLVVGLEARRAGVDAARSTAQPVAVQVRPIPNGFPLAHRGVEARGLRLHRARGRRRAADAGEEGRRTPARRCSARCRAWCARSPSKEGQEVKAGETLAVVEAMKMENVLRAERDGTVKAIKAKPGDSLAVDAVIMEFA